MNNLIQLCTNPAFISVILLCILCVKKVNVLLAIICSTLVAGLLANMDIREVMNVFISGMGDNSETALSYILLGAFAATMAHSGFTDVMSGKIADIVAGRNFGCGSSREHAAWALADYGFRAVVSSFFADIFKNNALNNGLLPVQVSEDFLQKILRRRNENRNMELRINLPEKYVEIVEGGQAVAGMREYFPIGEYKRHCLENGLSDIDYLITTRPIIENFEKSNDK